MSVCKGTDHKRPLAREESRNPHVPWIDVARGIGIILVVTGHFWPPGHRYIFWFHIPLFFLLSGMVFKAGPLSKTLSRKARRLLVPYAVYLALFTLFHIVRLEKDAFLFSKAIDLAGASLTGGRDLYGWYDVFWFVPVLFGATALYAWWRSFPANSGPGCQVFFLGVCCLLSIADTCWWGRGRSIPLALNVIPLGIVFFGLGNMAAEFRPDRLLPVSVSVAIVGMSVVAVEVFGVDLQLDMKWSVAGVPGFSVILACACSVIIALLSLALVRVPLAGRVMSEAGNASLTIMFLHRVVEDQVMDRFHVPDQPLLRVAAVILVCCAVHRVLYLSALSRFLFLGTGDRKPGTIPVMTPGQEQ